MRISRLEIEGFRGFNRNEVIDLDGDVIVVSGPNGSGKTSLLDAIQWLLIGDVPRLRAYSLRPTEDYLSNRYSGSPPYVSADFRDGSRLWTLRRRGLGKASEFSVHADGTRMESSEAVQMLLQLAGDSERRFLRTFSLQQEEVREFLKADPKERYEFLSQLAGLEDVQRLDSQLKGELKKLRESFREESDRLDTDRTRLAALESELRESRAIIDKGQSREDERQTLARRRFEEVLGITLVGEPEAVRRGISEAESLITRITTLSERIRTHEEEAAEAAGRLSQLAHDGDLSQTRTEIQKRLAEVERSLADHEARAMHLELQASEETSRESDRRQFAELALEQLGEVCPVCQQEYDRKHAVAHLRSLIKQKSMAATLREEANNHREVASRAASEITALREVLLQAEASFAEYQTLNRQTERARQLSEAGRADLTDLLAGRWEDPSAAVTELRNLIGALAGLTVDVSEGLTGRIGILEAELKAEKKRVEILERNLAELRDVVDQSEVTTKWLGERLIQAATAVVRGTTPLINEIYSRLDVHPSLRRFDFKVDRFYQAGRLRPWVFDDERKVDGNAAQVLSAAQLNALAVCVFLALNLKQTWSPLQLTLLDDPVQSMDDVNVLGLADTVRSIRAYRQMFVSTHDSSLAKLLWRKLRPLGLGQRTIRVQLAEWTREGPTVETETREAPPKDPGLELVAS